MKRKTCLLIVFMMLGTLLSGCGPDPNLPQEASLSVMTQNLRVETEDDGPENELYLRYDRFITLLEKYQPDLIGLQEYSAEWDFMLADYLEENGYGVIFQYRAEGDQEATPIVYKKSRFELLSHDFWWLSETPEIESPSWDDEDGLRCRIVTECRFRDKESGIEFGHINTHVGLTAYSEDESALLIRRHVEKKYKNTAVIVTGDFNFTEGSQAYDNITEGDTLINSCYLATEFGEVCGTCHGYQDDYDGDVIDYVFVNQKADATYYGVLKDKPDGHFVSDHYAVFTKNIIRR